MKLLDAYAAERGTVVGSWTMIGYNIPASQNFTYTDPELSDGSANIQGLSDKKGWQAANNAKLNDCPANSTWTISLSEATATNAAQGSPVAYTAVVPKAATGSSADCGALTPNFDKIGK